MTPYPRYEALDVLRGFALLGILMVNFEAFAMPVFIDFAWRVRQFTGAADVGAMWAMQFLCDGKFILIFSFLFGYGAQNQLARADPDAARAARRYQRRLGALFVIGLVHAVVLWSGDILTAYAIVGLFLVPLSKSPTRTLWLVAIFGWISSIGAEAAMGFIAGTIQADSQEAARTVLLYRSGAFAELAADRMTLLPLLLLTPVIYGPQILAAFTVGMIASRGRWFSDLAAEAPRWRRVLRYALPVAVLGNAIYPFLWAQAIRMGDGGMLTLAFAMRGLFPPFGSAVYVSAIALLLTHPAWRERLHAFAYPGRMSLSTYIGESFLCGFLFLGYGLQLYGKVGPARGALMMLVVYAVLALFARYWLTLQRAGPLEMAMRAFVERQK